MFRGQTTFKFNPWTKSYFEHVRGVQKTQGRTVGIVQGQSPDEAKEFAPIITADSPDAIGTMGGMTGPASYAYVPSRPFYKESFLPIDDSDGGGFTEIMPSGITYQGLNLPVIIGIILAIMYFLFP